MSVLPPSSLSLEPNYSFLSSNISCACDLGMVGLRKFETWSLERQSPWAYSLKEKKLQYLILLVNLVASCLAACNYFVGMYNYRCMLVFFVVCIAPHYGLGSINQPAAQSEWAKFNECWSAELKFNESRSAELKSNESWSGKLKFRMGQMNWDTADWWSLVLAWKYLLSFLFVSTREMQRRLC